MEDITSREGCGEEVQEEGLIWSPKVGKTQPVFRDGIVKEESGEK